jgi:hypothetical protein
MESDRTPSLFRNFKELGWRAPRQPSNHTQFHTQNKNRFRTARFSCVEPQALSMQRKDTQRRGSPNDSPEGLSLPKSELYVATSKMLTYFVPSSKISHRDRRVTPPSLLFAFSTGEISCFLIRTAVAEPLKGPLKRAPRVPIWRPPTDGFRSSGQRARKPLVRTHRLPPTGDSTREPSERPGS